MNPTQYAANFADTAAIKRWHYFTWLVASSSLSISVLVLSCIIVYLHVFNPNRKIDAVVENDKPNHFKTTIIYSRFAQ